MLVWAAIAVFHYCRSNRRKLLWVALLLCLVAYAGIILNAQQYGGAFRYGQVAERRGLTSRELVSESSQLSSEQEERFQKFTANSAYQSVKGNCSSTYRIRIEEQGGKWVLQTINEHGAHKLVGGDEFYIRYLDSKTGHLPSANWKSFTTTAVAVATDNSDGTYDLKFIKTPMHNNSVALSGEGKLFIVLEYTCGLGRMAPPSKDNFTNGGFINLEMFVEDIPEPPLHEFAKPVIAPTMNLANYDGVVAIGDSVMDRFIRVKLPRKREEFSRLEINGPKRFPNVYYSRFKNSLDSHNFPKLWGQHVQSYYRDHVPKKVKLNGTMAFLFGSSTWDILNGKVSQGASFDDHIEACERLVTKAREAYPNVQILWKSATPLLVNELLMKDPPATLQGVAYEYFTDRTRYMSASRSHFLYERQKELMKRLEVPFLDVYESYYLSADWLEEGDGRHWVGKFDDLVSNWYYDKTSSQPRE